MPLTKLPRSMTQNESASAARQALLSEDVARSGLLGPELGIQTGSVRSARQISSTSSADATGQALSKKARALARIRPFVHSFAASITAPAPAQLLKCQPLAFDDSSREAATASGLAIVKGFFEDRSMVRSTCACCDELKAPSRTRTVSIEEGGSWLARIRTRLTREHTAFACSAEVIDSTKRLYSSKAPLLAGIPLASSGVAIDEQGSVEVRGRTIRSKALNATDLLSPCSCLSGCIVHCSPRKFASGAA